MFLFGVHPILCRSVDHMSNRSKPFLCLLLAPGRHFVSLPAKMLVNLIVGLLLATTVDSHVIDMRFAINDCLTKESVPQNLPGTANFIQSIKPFNLRIPFIPVAVAVPSTVPQVQAAVKCGVANNVTISPKGGGHSYASHGIGGEDGHLVIDMKLFTDVNVDSATGIASIGAGSRLGNVATALYAQGQRAMSHGTCPGYHPPID